MKKLKRKVLKDKVEKKIDALANTVDKLALAVGNGFKNMEECFDVKLDTKIDGFRAEVNGRFADINGKFFEMKDQMNLLQNKMEHVEKLFDNNDAEHKVFRTKINHLEKA